ncbi:hypothetical protein [Acetivibrio cellulolyticus]|uniref:hypothetical protein n=1 Tax=Acetivibrio cellulolyticus TaxID=35830 RepID=UPI0001E2F67D|nr:hypothetical protein [Acetivibrio cellulolyticus]
MEDNAEYIVTGRPQPPKLEKTIIYVEPEELNKLRDRVGPFNQRTKEGGMSGKIRDLIKLYNANPEALELMLEKLKEEV